MTLANRVRVNITLSKENNKALDTISEETKIPRSRLVDIAIDLLQKEYEKKKIGF